MSFINDYIILDRFASTQVYLGSKSPKDITGACNGGSTQLRYQIVDWHLGTYRDSSKVFVRCRDERKFMSSSGEATFMLGEPNSEYKDRQLPIAIFLSICNIIGKEIRLANKSPAQVAEEILSKYVRSQSESNLKYLQENEAVIKNILRHAARSDPTERRDVLRELVHKLHKHGWSATISVQAAEIDFSKVVIKVEKDISISNAETKLCEGSCTTSSSIPTQHENTPASVTFDTNSGNDLVNIADQKISTNEPMPVITTTATVGKRVTKVEADTAMDVDVVDVSGNGVDDQADSNVFNTIKNLMNNNINNIIESYNSANEVSDPDMGYNIVRDSVLTDSRTQLIMSGIPQDITQDSLTNIINSNYINKTYDLAIRLIQRDFGVFSKASVAIILITDVNSVLSFYDIFHNQTWKTLGIVPPESEHDGRCYVSYAEESTPDTQSLSRGLTSEPKLGTAAELESGQSPGPVVVPYEPKAAYMSPIHSSAAPSQTGLTEMITTEDYNTVLNKDLVAGSESKLQYSLCDCHSDEKNAIQPPKDEKNFLVMASSITMQEQEGRDDKYGDKSSVSVCVVSQKDVMDVSVSVSAPASLPLTNISDASVSDISSTESTAHKKQRIYSTDDIIKDKEQLTCASPAHAENSLDRVMNGKAREDRQTDIVVERGHVDSSDRETSSKERHVQQSAYKEYRDRIRCRSADKKKSHYCRQDDVDEGRDVISHSDRIRIRSVDKPLERFGEGGDRLRSAYTNEHERERVRYYVDETTYDNQIGGIGKSLKEGVHEDFWNRLNDKYQWTRDIEKSYRGSRDRDPWERIGCDISWDRDVYREREGKRYREWEDDRSLVDDRSWDREREQDREKREREREREEDRTWDKQSKLGAEYNNKEKVGAKLGLWKFVGVGKSPLEAVVKNEVDGHTITVMGPTVRDHIVLQEDKCTVDTRNSRIFPAKILSDGRTRLVILGLPPELPRSKLQASIDDKYRDKYDDFNFMFYLRCAFINFKSVVDVAAFYNDVYHHHFLEMDRYKLRLEYARDQECVNALEASLETRPFATPIDVNSKSNTSHERMKTQALVTSDQNIHRTSSMPCSETVGSLIPVSSTEIIGADIGNMIELLKPRVNCYTESNSGGKKTIECVITFTEESRRTLCLCHRISINLTVSATLTELKTAISDTIRVNRVVVDDVDFITCTDYIYYHKVRFPSVNTIKRCRESLSGDLLGMIVAVAPPGSYSSTPIVVAIPDSTHFIPSVVVVDKGKKTQMDKPATRPPPVEALIDLTSLTPSTDIQPIATTGIGRLTQAALPNSADPLRPNSTLAFSTSSHPTGSGTGSGVSVAARARDPRTFVIKAADKSSSSYSSTPRVDNDSKCVHDLTHDNNNGSTRSNINVDSALMRTYTIMWSESSAEFLGFNEETKKFSVTLPVDATIGDLRMTVASTVKKVDPHDISQILVDWRIGSTEKVMSSYNKKRLMHFRDLNRNLNACNEKIVDVIKRGQASNPGCFYTFISCLSMPKISNFLQKKKKKRKWNKTL